MTATGSRLTDVSARSQAGAVGMALDPLPASRARRIDSTLMLAGIFAWVSVWAMLFPWTGEGDSAAHYTNLMEATHDFGLATHPWARPGWKIVLLPAAMLGFVWLKLWIITLTVALCWQTIRLAEDLKLPRAPLAALLLVAQPLTFYHASDTMTEIPFALLMLVACRLWTGGWFAVSCAVVGYGVTVRPEGFFLAPLWGVLCLCWPGVGGLWARVGRAALLSVGLLLWMLAGKLFNNDWLYLIASWSWPTDSKPSYGSGGLLDHVILWPYYCGPVLVVLFVAGLRRALRRDLLLPWLVWLTVFGVHSLLWWLGKFGAMGLMRIQISSAFLTAIVCLIGWNTLADALARRVSIRARRVVGAAAVVAMCVVAMLYTLVNPEAWHHIPSRRLVAHARAHQLFETVPAVFASEQIAVAQAGLWDRRFNRLIVRESGEAMRRRLDALPIGATGVWDNQRGTVWHDVSFNSLEAMGFETLHTERFSPPISGVARAMVWELRRRPVEFEFRLIRKSQSPAP